MSREFALPHSRPRWAPDRVVDVEHLRLVLEVDPAARRLAGRATLTVAVIAPGTRWVELDAVELTIEAVAVDGAAAPFVADGHRLRVDLGAPLGAGVRRAIEVRYHGAPRRGLYFIGPDAGYPDKPVQAWSQGQDEDSRHWFPCVDAPHEKATSEVIVTVPATMYALSNGVLVDDRTDGDRRTLHWRLDVPHSCYLVTLAVGEFATVEARAGELPLSYHVVRGREDDAARTLARTPAMIEFFSRRFGVAYPYPRYAQVFVSDFIFGGMENTSATTLTDTVLLDARAALDHDVDALVAHELAHQWFGDLVTCRDWGEGWLNEGFATYAEYLWREHHGGRDEADLELDEWADAYFGEDRGRYRRTIATKVYDEPVDIFDHHLYEKGGRVLHMLRAVLGDDAFFATIKHYLDKHRFGVVETRDLARAVEDATGRVLDYFFDQWVLAGAGHPELEVGCAWDADAGRAVVTVKQVHAVDARTPRFRLPTRLRFRVGAVDHDVEVEVAEALHVFHVALPAEPTQVIFDPGQVLLAERKVDKRPTWWAAELAGATLALDRIAAARALGKLGGPVAEDALARALTTDPVWAVRGAAAAGLATIRSARARAALLAALAAEPQPRTRRAIVTALGEIRDDDQVAAALAGVVEAGDPSYFVEAAACVALGKTRSPGPAPRCGRRAARRLRRRHPRQRHRGLAEARDDDAVPLLADGTAWGRPTQGRRGGDGAGPARPRPPRSRRPRDPRAARGAARRSRLPGPGRRRRGGRHRRRSRLDRAAARHDRARARRPPAPARARGRARPRRRRRARRGATPPARRGRAAPHPDRHPARAPREARAADRDGAASRRQGRGADARPRDRPQAPGEGAPAPLSPRYPSASDATSDAAVARARACSSRPRVTPPTTAWPPPPAASHRAPMSCRRGRPHHGL
ncbi:MAG: M1 family aminopeptidase [Kofleriaceae bacterium]